MGDGIGARWRSRVRGGRGPHSTVPAGTTPSGTAPWTHAAVARVCARRPGARPVVPAAALAGTALLAAACGGGSGTAASAQLTNYRKALAYSQCMRAHGEPGFPDPQPNGNLLIDGPKDHLNGALMNSASKACQHLMPKAPPLTAAQQQKLTAQALRFVACMRAHGLSTFPDPQVNSGGIELQLPKGLQPNSPVFRAAQQACKKLMPGLP
jgi:hypothetical protein